MSKSDSEAIKERADLVQTLVLYQGDIQKIVERLREFPFDCPTPLVALGWKQVAHMSKLFCSSEIDYEELAEWADAVEVRDDIEFEDECVQQVINEWATPEVFGRMSTERMQTIGEELRDPRCPGHEQAVE